MGTLQMTKTIKQIVIFDLDNCLSDDQWRLHMIDIYNLPFASEHQLMACYDNYHLLSPWDSARHIDFFNSFPESTFDRIVVTSRPEKFRTMTYEWLSRSMLHPRRVLMRANDDFRNCVEVKQSMVERLKPELIHHAFDDKADVVAMYRILGIKAEILAINDRTLG